MQVQLIEDGNEVQILVVDDDKSARDYLATFLTSCGFHVDCLGSGDEAIERLASGYYPSLMLLDVMLPGKDGIEVLSSVKSLNLIYLR